MGYVIYYIHISRHVIDWRKAENIFGKRLHLVCYTVLSTVYYIFTHISIAWHYRTNLHIAYLRVNHRALLSGETGLDMG